MPTRSNVTTDNRLIVTTSWDDGTVSDLKLSALMDMYSIKGTFYICKTYHWLERNLTESEIVELGRVHEIGAHTLTHPDLRKIGAREAYDEIQGSKIYLEEVLSRKIRLFCYPGGKYNESIVELVRTSGFVGARTLDYDDNTTENPYKLKISLHASNGSPRMAIKTFLKYHLRVNTITDWEARSKDVFDAALRTGGIYHLWGHASEFEKSAEWDKLERVFEYISNKPGVSYVSNEELVDRLFRI